MQKFSGFLGLKYTSDMTALKTPPQVIEEIEHFVNNSIQDSLEKQHQLKIFVGQQRDGLGIADLGAKIAFQEGIIEGLKIVRIILGKENRWMGD